MSQYFCLKCFVSIENFEDHFNNHNGHKIEKFETYKTKYIEMVESQFSKIDKNINDHNDLENKVLNKFEEALDTFSEIMEIINKICNTSKLTKYIESEKNKLLKHVDNNQAILETVVNMPIENGELTKSYDPKYIRATADKKSQIKYQLLNETDRMLSNMLTVLGNTRKQLPNDEEDYKININVKDIMTRTEILECEAPFKIFKELRKQVTKPTSRTKNMPFYIYGISRGYESTRLEVDLEGCYKLTRNFYVSIDYEIYDTLGFNIVNDKIVIYSVLYRIETYNIPKIEGYNKICDIQYGKELDYDIIHIKFADNNQSKSIISSYIVERISKTELKWTEIYKQSYDKYIYDFLYIQRNSRKYLLVTIQDTYTKTFDLCLDFNGEQLKLIGGFKKCSIWVTGRSTLTTCDNEILVEEDSNYATSIPIKWLTN